MPSEGCRAQLARGTDTVSVPAEWSKWLHLDHPVRSHADVLPRDHVLRVCSTTLVVSCSWPVWFDPGIRVFADNFPLWGIRVFSLFLDFLRFIFFSEIRCCSFNITSIFCIYIYSNCHFNLNKFHLIPCLCLLLVVQLFVSFSFSSHSNYLSCHCMF